MNPLQWMGAVRMRVQTADKNITIIHITPVHQLTSCEVKSCMFVRNKSIKTFFQLNYESSIHNLVFFQWKSCLVWIRREICTDQTLFTRKNLNKYVGGFWCERKTRFFSCKEALLWIMDSHFSQKQQFTLKNALMMDLFLTNTQLFSIHKTLIDGLMDWLTGLVWIVMFLSGVWTHSDGTHSLQRIHWSASDVMLHFPKSDEEINVCTSWMAWWRVHFLKSFYLRIERRGKMVSKPSNQKLN